MADATVKTSMTLPDYKSISPSMDIIATDESGHGVVDFGYGGFRPKVNPLPSLSPSGTLHHRGRQPLDRQGLRALQLRRPHLQAHPIKQVAAAKEVVNGVPHHLTFHYQTGDFAKVAIKHYATGPDMNALDGWFGFSPIDVFAFVELYPTQRPGIVHAMFEGNNDLPGTADHGQPDFRGFAQTDHRATYRRGQQARSRSSVAL